MNARYLHNYTLDTYKVGTPPDQRLRQRPLLIYRRTFMGLLVSVVLEKYNTRVPRYTSYPTVPHWNTIPPTQEQWFSLLRENYKSKDGFSPTNTKGPNVLTRNSCKLSHGRGKFSAVSNSGIDLKDPSKLKRRP